MPEKLMTTEEMEKWLHCSHEGLLRWRARQTDPLPALKAGKRWLYDPGMVRKWLERQGKRAVEAGPRLRRAKAMA